MVLLRVELKPVDLLRYSEEQYLGELEAMEKWVEKAEHSEVKQRKMMTKHLRPKMRP